MVDKSTQVTLYVYERLFQVDSKLCKHSQRQMQSLALLMAHGEVTAMPVAKAVDRNRTLWEKYLQHSKNICKNVQYFFPKETCPNFPPKWLQENVFLHSDVKCLKKIADPEGSKKLDKTYDNLWCRAKDLVADIRRDYQPVYNNICKTGVPAGKQLKELLEKMRHAIFEIESLRKKKSVTVEVDDTKNDDIETQRIAAEETKEDATSGALSTAAAADDAAAAADADAGAGADADADADADPAEVVAVADDLKCDEFSHT